MKSFTFPTSIHFNVNLSHIPFPGRIVPDTVERLGPDKYRLYINVEAHGQPINEKSDQRNMELFDAAGHSITQVAGTFEWTLDSNPSYRAAFITSISTGDKTNRLSGQIFGVLPNIQAQSVTVNGVPMNFDANDFWTWSSVQFVKGTNTLNLRVTATDGQVFEDTVTFTTEPMRLSFIADPGFPSASIDLEDHIYYYGARGGGILLAKPPWYPVVSYNSLGYSDDHSYFRKSPLPTYMDLTYYTYWPRSTSSMSQPIPANDYGIWEMRWRNETEFWLWVNFTRTDLPVTVSLMSHSDGQNVSGPTAEIRVATPNHGYAHVTINGVAATPTWTQRTVGNNIRVDQTHTAIVPLTLGPNTITVTTDGMTPGTLTFTLNRTNWSGRGRAV